MTPNGILGAVDLYLKRSAALLSLNIGSDFPYPALDLLESSPQRLSLFPENTMFVDSGRSALLAVLTSGRFGPGSSVLVPVYICSSVVATIIRAGLVPRFYPIERDLVVNLEKLATLNGKTVAAALVVGYFGYEPQSELVNFLRDRGIPIIFDLTHSLLSGDLLTVYSAEGEVVASLRKLLPLPEGGIIVASESSAVATRFGIGVAPHAGKRLAAMMLKAAALNENPDNHREYRTLFLEAEHLLDESNGLPYWMSDPGLMLLRLLKIDQVISRRRSNFAIYEEEARGWHGNVRPLLGHLDPNVCPLGFPIVLDSAEARDSLRNFLIARGVFPPIHWLLPAEQARQFPSAEWLQNRVMTLPLDQRYDAADMRSVSMLIRQWSEAYYSG